MPHWASHQGTGQLLTSNAGVGLLDMVEPQGRQVEHLASPHCAAKGLGLTITGVLSQIRGQWIQWDPGYLGTQEMPGNRLKAPGPLIPSLPKVNTMGPALPAQHWEAPDLEIFQSKVPQPRLFHACSSEPRFLPFPLPGAQDKTDTFSMASSSTILKEPSSVSW